MQKILLFGLVGVLVVVAGILALLFKNSEVADVKNGDLVNMETVPDVNTALKFEAVGNGSLKSLLNQAVNLECTIKYAPEGESAVEGKYFTNQGKMRGDFVVESEGMSVVSSMIMLDEKLYSWSEIDGQKYGVLIDLKEVETQSQNGNVPDTKEPVPLEAEVAYDCKSWTQIDNSIFEPPSDIKFQDFSNIMESGMEFGNIYEETIGTEDQCALCARLPAGEGRDSCQVTFSCR